MKAFKIALIAVSCAVLAYSEVPATEGERVLKTASENVSLLARICTEKPTVENAERFAVQVGRMRDALRRAEVTPEIRGVYERSATNYAGVVKSVYRSNPQASKILQGL